MQAVDLAARQIYSFRLSFRVRAGLPGRLGLWLVLLVALMAVPASRSPDTLSARLTDVAGLQAFDLTRWEVQTLANRLVDGVIHPAQPATSGAVAEYARLTADDERARAARDEAW